MANNYFTNKELLKEKARTHTKEMDENFSKDIAHSVSNSTIYGPDPVTLGPVRTIDDMPVLLVDEGSTEAIFNHAEGRTAVLNFASYRHPGGMFYEGSSAQEESLCHDSFLYNVLRQFPAYYEWNEKNKNRALYMNRAIYSKDIMFFNGDTAKKCDVITCAAPNLSWGIRNRDEQVLQDNKEVLKSRIDFVLAIAAQQEVDTLILGAFGCGVFKQPAQAVAKIFVTLLKTKYKCFKKIVFAVPRGINQSNYNAFKEALSR